MPTTDAELAALARVQAGVESALGALRALDPENADQAQREAWMRVAQNLTEALQPICERAMTIQVVTIAGLHAKAQIAGWWSPAAGVLASDDLDRMVCRSLFADLAALSSSREASDER